MTEAQAIKQAFRLMMTSMRKQVMEEEALAEFDEAEVCDAYDEYVRGKREAT